MIKIFSNIFIFIFLSVVIASGCSSNPTEKDYYKTDIEDQGDQYLLTGDHYRLNDKLDEAKDYYKQSAQLYFYKGQKAKFVIAKIREALIEINQKNFENYLHLYGELVLVNQVEKLYLDNEIKFLSVRYQYAINDLVSAEKNLNDLIKYYDDHNNDEKRIYYSFVKLKYGDKNQNTEKEKFEKDLKWLLGKYHTGELTNIEILIFALSTFIDNAMNTNDLAIAKKYLDIADQIYQKLELAKKRKDLLAQFYNYYLKIADPIKASFYKDQIDKQSKLDEQFAQ